MKSTDSPLKISLPFANNGQANSIPNSTPTGSNAASYDAGFPPITMLKKTQGGIPPDGKDFNGILKSLSLLNRWSSTGSVTMFDSAFSEAIGGYPKGALLLGTDYLTLWLSTADDNTNDPNSTPTGWQKLSDELKNSLGLGTAAFCDVGTTGEQLITANNFKAVFNGANEGGASIFVEVSGANALILKWGSTSAGVTNRTVTFATPFPTTVINVFAGDDGWGGGNRWGATNKTATGFTFHTDGANEGGAWLAIGY